MQIWMKTDNNQWVKKLDEDNYVVIEVSIYEEDYYVHEVTVGLSELDEKDLREAISGFYDSLEQLKTECQKDWKQVVAEIIAENEVANTDTDESFCTLEEVSVHLKQQYGIIAA